MAIEEETADDVVQMLDDVREELFATAPPEHEGRAPAWFVELRTRLDRRLREVQLAAAGLSSRAA